MIHWNRENEYDTRPKPNVFKQLRQVAIFAGKGRGIKLPGFRFLFAGSTTARRRAVAAGLLILSAVAGNMDNERKHRRRISSIGAR
jgi:hypothetical protein